jgi:energy-coupling factor transporter ATP-binding protein EcfA2
MLDEPSIGLAPKLLEEPYDLLVELREEGTTILLVDQVATLALTVADRAYVPKSGRRAFRRRRRHARRYRPAAGLPGRPRGDNVVPTTPHETLTCHARESRHPVVTAVVAVY